MTRHLPSDGYEPHAIDLDAPADDGTLWFERCESVAVRGERRPITDFVPRCQTDVTIGTLP